MALTLLLSLFRFLATVDGRAASFEEGQRRFPRVRAAFAENGPRLLNIFAKAGLPFPPSGIFLRAFKREKIIELWAQAGPNGPMRHVKDFPICYFSGGLGPKRREGDGQVPEGFYAIARFNPQSQFHLSLGLDYPNASDRILGRDGRLGGDIFIHGNCVSIGCLAITDELIKELYPIAVLARSQGQVRIPVHVFPARMDRAGMDFLKAAAALKPEAAGDSLWQFWKGLKAGYDAFEKNRRVHRVEIADGGRYQIRD